MCVLALFALACGANSDGSEPARDAPRILGDAEVGGDVVSTVDGHPITLAEVEDAARRAGVSPELALRRLQDEALLAHRAERAGHADDTTVRDATRRARVQALLARAVEAEVGEAEVGAAELATAFQENLARFERPERRLSVHVLALVPEGASPEIAAAAERWIRETHAELAAAAEPEAAALAMRRRAAEGPFEVRVEEVGGLPRNARADRAYLDAIYALDAPGLVPAPVRSAFGWHAIVVTAIEPAWEASEAEALDVLRQERVAALRGARLESFVQELASERGVQVDLDVARRALTDPRLTEER